MAGKVLFSILVKLDLEKCAWEKITENKGDSNGWIYNFSLNSIGGFPIKIETK